MGERLSGAFISCLEHLCSNKVTERKNAVENFPRLLSEEGVVRILDINSSKNDETNWSSLLKVVKRFISKEADNIISKTAVRDGGTRKLTSTMETSRNNCVTLFKTLVKAAGRKRPNSKPPNFFSCILSVLNRNEMRSLFGQEFSLILMKDVLTSEILVKDITHEQFLTLFKTYKGFFKTLPEGWKLSSILGVFEKLLYISKNIVLEPKVVEEIFQLLEEIFTRIGDETINHYEGLVQATLDFSRRLALDFRLCVCSLGEKTIPHFLNFWSKTIPFSLQAKLIEFFYLQIVIHNPSGQLEVGSLACDKKKWTNILKSLFDMLVRECERGPQKSKASSNYRRGICWVPEFVSLTVEVCNLVFLIKDGPPELGGDAVQTFKKPRSMYTVFTILNPLKESKSTFEIIPRLQVLGGLLEKYHFVFQLDELVQLLNTILHIQLATKQVEVRSCLLQCNCSLIVAYMAKKSASDKAVFDKVLEHTVKMVALNQCHENSHKLLQSLLLNKLVKPSSDFHQLYAPGSSNHVTWSSLETLIIFLENYSIPSNFSVYSTSKSSKEKLYVYQEQILQWMFPSSDEYFIQRFREDLPIFSKMAKVLLFLCCREGNGLFCEKNKVNSSMPVWSNYEDLKEDLLKSTFDFEFEKPAVFKSISNECPNPTSFIAEIKTQILLSLDNETGFLFDPNQTLALDIFAKEACFLIIFQKLMRKHKVPFEFCKLDDLIKRILVQIGDFLTPCSKETISLTSNVVKALLYAVEFESESSAWLVPLFPQKLLDSLMMVFTTEEMDFSISLPPSARGSFAPTSTSTQFNSSVSRNDLDDLVGMEPITSQAVNANTGSKTEKPACLITIKADIAKFFVKFCFGRFPQEDYKKQLLTFINCDKINILDAENVHLVISFTQSLIESDLDLNDSEVAYVIKSIRSIFRTHKTKNEFASNCIRVLEKCIAYSVPKEGESRERVENRDLLLRMSKALWTRESQELQDVTFILPLMDLTTTFLQFDISAAWYDYDKIENQELEAPFRDLIRMLKSPRLRVRLHAAAKLGEVLSGLANSHKPENLKKLKVIFDKCYAICTQICEDPRGDSNDTLSPFLSSLLMFLYQSASSSLSCERDSVFGLIQIGKVKNVSTNILSKVLIRLGKKLGLSSELPIVLNHILFIVSRWLELNNPLSEFPFVLFECQTLREFYRKYQSLLVPLLIHPSEKEKLDEIAKELGVESKTVVVGSFAAVMTSILPWLMDEKPENARKKSKAAASHEIVREIITDEVFAAKISEDTNKIVLGLLLSLNETPNNHRLKRLKHFLPPATSANFPWEAIEKSLDFLKSGVPDIQSTIELVARRPCGIPNLLFGIRAELCKAERKEERCRVILVYILFLELVLGNGLLRGTLEATSSFIVREIAQTFINEIRLLREPLLDIDKCLAAFCIEGLRYLCSDCIGVLANTGSDLVPKIIDCVLILKDYPTISNDVVGLLNLLIVENGETLKEILSSIDELPDDTFLRDIRQKHNSLKRPYESLEEVMQTFVNNSCRRKDSVRPEGLLHLLGELRKRREELVNMARFIQNGKLFSEDLEESALHLTICHLLSFSQSNSLEIQQIAAQCLGEIGTVDFGSPILPTISRKNKENSFMNSEEYEIYSDLFSYAGDERMNVFSAATVALKTLFSTQDGRKFISSCKRNGETKLSQYFQPLLTQSVVTIDPFDIYFTIVDNGELWCPKNTVSYHSWISQLVCSILRTGAHKSYLLKELGPLCLVEPKFCEKILPYAISCILQHGNEKYKEILSNHISNFVTKHCLAKENNKVSDSQNTITSEGNLEDSLYLDKNAVMSILNVVHYLRMKNKEKNKSTVWQTDFALNISYFHMASAASYCGRHFTSLMYLELWCDEMNRIMKTNEDPDFNSQGSAQITCLNAHEDINKVQNLLLEAFQGIGDIDGVQGCSRVFGDSFPLRLCLYEQENKWDRVLSVCDSEMTQENTTMHLGVLKALRKSSLTNTFKGYLRGLMIDVSEPSPELLEYQAECSWRASQWNFTPSENSNPGVHQILFKSLNYLENRDYDSSLKQLKIGRQNVLSAIPQFGILESVKSVYPFLSHLQAFSIIETAIRHKDLPVERLLNEWETVNLIPFSQFELFEQNLHVQTVILGQMVIKQGGGHEVKGLQNSLRNILKIAREENHLEVAFSALQKLKKLYQDSEENSLRLRLEEARIYWCRGEINVAKQVLKSLIKPLEKQVDEKESSTKTPLYAETLIQYGEWQAETSGESTSTILSNYLEKAMTMLKKLSSHKDLLYDAYLAIARYSDAQYLSLKKYRNAPEFQKMIKAMEETNQEAKELKEIVEKNNKEMRKAIHIREKHCSIDKDEFNSLEENLKEFREKALKNYIYCLRDNNAHDSRVFRVISLWFESYQDGAVNNIMKAVVQKLPSYKFLPLIYQLAARMGTQDCEEFERILILLIKKMCKDHPHHTVPILLALCNANKDIEMTQPQASKSSRRDSVSDSQNKRISAANEVLSSLRKLRPEYVTQIENLAHAYIDLAYVSTANLKQMSKQKLPKGLKLQRGTFDKVPVLTREIPVDLSCEYNNLVCVKNFGPEFYLCSGINAPKRIECFGDDGRRYLELVKGQDDIRQDAVMQQVFTLVNSFLEKNVETKKRKLGIRTYKIVPLSKRSGILQWCEGTQPFGEYLIGGGKDCAHSRYYPNEWTANKCRSHLSLPGNNASKLKLYQDICENFSPVFRYFFLEHFPEPTKWYERRLAYSRSVAVNSIVGYILGLGDRHVQNILVDKHTAELVHIDFGIAFEQGKILPTPETVPFRLTREIVDGFGICGVEGTFRQCCEKTMEVMRSSQESLLTILEVLLYDPLYLWSISPDKAAYIQQKRVKENESRLENGNDCDNNQTVEVNKLAERVLLRLQQKLQGVEDNVALSVSGQVGLLIQQARDPENLCRIFAGWQPYL